MARRDALLRLYNQLVSQRDSLRQKLAEDLGLVYAPDDGTNDLGETALHVETAELHTQLAALESRELREIDAALVKIRQGTYGTCERCQKAIPVSRLQAVPFAATCIGCQKRRERRGGEDEETAANWASAMEYERRAIDQELTLSDIDYR
jgi:DnaK suppressor protein